MSWCCHSWCLVANVGKMFSICFSVAYSIVFSSFQDVSDIPTCFLWYLKLLKHFLMNFQLVWRVSFRYNQVVLVLTVAQTCFHMSSSVFICTYASSTMVSVILKYPSRELSVVVMCSNRCSEGLFLDTALF